MSEPGWYPDPGGRPGHFRFWDGRVWSAATTSELPAGAPGPVGRPPAPRRRRTGLWVGLAAGIVLVLVVVGVLALSPGGAPVAATTPDASSTEATSAGDPSETDSTDPEPSTGTSSPAVEDSPSDAPTSADTEAVGACRTGDPLSRQDHPDDRRVHGGGLSFPDQDGWTLPGERVDAFTWAYDVGETDRRTDEQGFSAYAVGAVSVVDGFDSPRRAAELMLRCTLATGFFPGVARASHVLERQTTVDDLPAFTVVAQVPGASGDPDSSGDVVVITVVDLDSPESLAFFWGSAPRDDAELTTRLETVAGQVRID